MDLKTVIDSAPTLKKPRRTFTAEFKHQLIQQCQQPDTSVAKVAMQHQINANLLHKWIRQSRSMPPALKTPSIPQTDFFRSFFTRLQSNKKHLYHLSPRRRKLSLISGFH
ncbi:transposase, partial [Acinetobacter baumannii]|uniref:transposase n=1 Tax=Acinetobacter baumannii TaxID=470 RepID=UPI0002BC60F4